LLSAIHEYSLQSKLFQESIVFRSRGLNRFFDLDQFAVRFA